MSNKLSKRKLHPSIWEIIFSFPKTICFNYRVLPFKKAIKLPIFVSCYTKIKGANKKNFICNFDEVSFGMCRIGISGSETGLLIKKKSLLYIHNNGKIVLNGSVALSRGIYLEANGGVITFGNNTKMNTGCYIEAEKSSITIGNDCSFGWNCVLKNCDGHFIIENGKTLDNSSDIVVGNHCWVCSEASILKGGYLGNNCVLAYKSILTKKISDNEGCLYAGSPAKIIKENINWKV